jgi:hypothetical protein
LWNRYHQWLLRSSSFRWVLFSASYSRINTCSTAGKQICVWYCHPTYCRNPSSTIFWSIVYRREGSGVGCCALPHFCKCRKDEGWSSIIFFLNLFTTRYPKTEQCASLYIHTALVASAKFPRIRALSSVSSYSHYNHVRWERKAIQSMHCWGFAAAQIVSSSSVKPWWLFAETSAGKWWMLSLDDTSCWDPGYFSSSGPMGKVGHNFATHARQWRVRILNVQIYVQKILWSWLMGNSIPLRRWNKGCCWI